MCLICLTMSITSTHFLNLNSFPKSGQRFSSLKFEMLPLPL